MFALLVIVLFGIFFSFLATQNTVGVPINILGYQWANIPLYLISLISLFIGIALAWVLSFFGWASTMMTLRGKDSSLRKSESEIESLKNRIRQLEEQNKLLKNEKQNIQEDAHEQIDAARERNPHGNFLDRFRHTFSRFA